MIPVKITVKKNEFVNVFVYESDFKKAEQTGSLAYWIRGIGHKKTKKFERIEAAPERNTGYKMSWLQIAKYTEQYGLNIGEGYGECKTAGIVARQTAAGYTAIYKKVKHLLQNGDDEFFALLRCDYMMSCFGMYELDIIRLDETFQELDPEYNHVACLYKDEPCSMSNYVLLKYGQRMVDIVDACTKMPDIVKQCEIYRPGKGFVEETVDSNFVKRWIKARYTQPNLLQLVLDEFEAWAEELDLTRLVKDVCNEIDNQTLSLNLV